jgi:hypothetical protein
MSQPQPYPERQQPDRDQLLRDMRNDLRFLSYRAGRPHPFVLKYFLLSFLLIFAPIFLVELWVTFVGPIHPSLHPAVPVSHSPKEVRP